MDTQELPEYKEDPLLVLQGLECYRMKETIE